MGRIDRDVLLPPGFRFGVACSGFQVEGGYNGLTGPANNWLDWENDRRRGLTPSGAALDFWNSYDQHLDRAVAAGCDAFRFSVEWARCEPRQGEFDEAAFERYQLILEGCHRRGLLPVVALHHFAHPNWLGPQFWLQPSSPDRFANWVSAALERLSDRCQHWVTINEPNGLALGSFMVGLFPPGRILATGDAVRCVDHLLTAHVLAYSAIHTRQPQAIVSTNNHASSVYELDRLLLDVLLARSHGTPRADLAAWLAERKAQYYAALPPAGRMESVIRTTAGTLIPRAAALPRAVAAAYDSSYERSLDVVLVDYYSPVTGEHLRMPGHMTAGGRNWRGWRAKWDERIDPEGLMTYCRANHEPGLELWVCENGLCNRVTKQRAYPRSDGWDRKRYLRAHLAAVVEAVEEGLPVTGYFHWTLADNYEWGSYEQRYGLHRVDHDGDGRWDDLDSFGGDAAGTYRRLAEGLRAGDRSVLLS